MKNRITAWLLAGMLLAGCAGNAWAAESMASAKEPAVSGAEEMMTEESGPELTKGRIRFAKDFSEIHKALLDARNRWYNGYDYIIEDAEMYAVEEAPAFSNSVSSKPAYSEAVNEDTSGYSATNVRTEGVDEADVVKTDGKYLYILKSNRRVSIVKAGGADMSECAMVEAAGDDFVSVPEFFVNGHFLHLIVEGLRDAAEGKTNCVKVQTYDITDPAEPAMIGESTQDGYYKEARLAGGKLYIISEWRPVVMENEEDSDLSLQVGGTDAPAERFCIPEIVTDPDYLIMASVNPEKPSDIEDYKILISGAEKFYAGSGSFYALNTDESSWRTKTEIVKFSYEDGRIEGKSACTIRGTVDDTWSIDEYSGHTRVLTTYMGTTSGAVLEALAGLFGVDYYAGDRWVRHNALYILDEDLNITGYLGGIAEHEDIKSARFMGDIVYFVTFLNTDPLFAADLSDPAAPKIIGELKLPGFSAYLHPMDGDLLAGLGYDADEIFGITEGLKISVFDRSDPADVKETGRTFIKNVSYCPAFDNYKAVFASAEEGLIGFGCDNHYFLYSITADGNPERVLLYDFYEDNVQSNRFDAQVRGVRIGRWFYVAGEEFVAAFDMDKAFAKAGVLKLMQ